jgi:LPXTG-motif cell wall-anchored protein
VQVQVQVDVIGTDPIPTPEPTTPEPTTPEPTHTDGGGGTGWWACYKDNKWVSDYTTHEDCIAHGGTWKFVFDGINNGGGGNNNGGGGGSSVIVGPGGTSPNVIVNPSGGASSGSGVTLAPVVNPGENIIINQVPQVDASGQVSYPAQNVQKYCTFKGITSAQECVAAGYQWVDLTASTSALDLTHILIIAGIALLLLLVLLFLLKRRRDNSFTGMFEQMMRSRFGR